MAAMVLHLFAALLLLSGYQPAEVQGPAAPLPRVTPDPRCRQSDNPEEIVVCGQSGENSPYRVPHQFRNQRTNDDAVAAWTNRVEDESAVARFGDQTIGGSGYLQRSRQQDCAWRVAQQERQGRRPDCGASHHPNHADDDQRRAQVR
jgi:hypothetical protein